MMWGYNGFGGFGGGWGMGIGMLLFWAVVIAGIVLVARAFARHPRDGYGGDPMRDERRAIDILRERYARGEIDKRDFEERLADLERSSSSRR